MNSLAQTAVVILNYNGKHWLEKFLPSVIAHSAEAQIIVADNASTDNSVDFLRLSFPQVKLICFEQNLGFCKGYNEALKQIEAKYFVLLNSDIEVSSNWLLPLIDFLEKNSEVIVVQPKIKSFYQKTYFEYAGASGGFLDKWGYAFCRGRIFDTCEKDEGQYNEPCEIFWATGACMVVRAEWWHKLGGFDENLFAHFEEIDFCWRVQRTGGKVFCVAESEVFHVGGGTLNASNPRKTFLNYRNNLIVLAKNLPFPQCFYKVFIRLFLDGLSAMLFLKKGEWKHIWAIIKAHWAFYAYLLFAKKQKQKLPQKVTLPKISIVWAYFVKGRKTFQEIFSATSLAK
ncbi:glycosyltransferase family 2 protein [Raineya orbicola]|jgi:GT2 family glycosyltransferase|uniref:Putative glycosyltransferase n=1 Tax=Raineya orbicola TaxID=2016530 RepID=A0A2N3IKK0_9BACT|nr:glycosyltransferase [Raineya orbicola]PKQ70811.1 putative glycosyltransferase [Raineya orbicola]